MVYNDFKKQNIAYVLFRFLNLYRIFSPLFIWLKPYRNEEFYYIYIDFVICFNFFAC